MITNGQAKNLLQKRRQPLDRSGRRNSQKIIMSKIETKRHAGQQDVICFPATFGAGSCTPKILLRGDTEVETRVTLKVVIIGTMRYLIYTKIENASLCSLLWTQAVIGVRRVLIYSEIENSSICSLPWTSCHSRSKACSYIHEVRECKPLFATMDTSCHRSKACSYILGDRECKHLFVTMDKLS